MHGTLPGVARRTHHTYRPTTSLPTRPRLEPTRSCLEPARYQPCPHDHPDFPCLALVRNLQVDCDAGLFAAIGGRDVDRLPSASTCYNMLKLPNYRRAATLKAKLLYSITSGAGFELS